MSGGGKGGGTQKVSTDPWKPAQPYILGGMQGAQDLYQNGPGFYTPRNSVQQMGDQSALGFANNFGNMFSPYMNASQQALYPGDPMSNPTLGSYFGQTLNAPNTVKNDPPLQNYVQQSMKATDVANNPYV